MGQEPHDGGTWTSEPLPKAWPRLRQAELPDGAGEPPPRTGRPSVTPASAVARDGPSRAGITATRAAAAAVSSASLIPCMNDAGEPYPPCAANTAARTATPNSPPVSRSVLLEPAATPESAAGT